MNLKNKLRDLNIAIVSHIYAHGPPLELENYLRSRVRSLIFVGHPFSFAEDVRSFYRIYKNGELIKEKRVYPWRFPDIILYLKDVFFTLLWILRFQRCDLYIGANNLNALCGLCLKRLGHVKRVVFYTIDYIPKRFENKILNWIYHWVDRFCIKHCDYVWNLSSVMVARRELSGVNPKYRRKQITVPIGTNSKVKRLHFAEINRYDIAFMGHLREGQGVELLIQAMPEIIEQIPQVRLVVIGGGPLEEKLKRQADELGLKNNIEFNGFIEDHAEVENRLAKCAVGIAPYVDDEKTYTRYTDPGKPKVYLSAGLPVIITKVPQVAYQIDQAKAGLAIDYDKEQLVRAVNTLLAPGNLLRIYRCNALEFARKFEWTKIFRRALRSTFI